MRALHYAGPLRHYYTKGSYLAYRLRGLFIGSNGPLMGSCLGPGVVNFYLNLASPRLVDFVNIADEAIFAQSVK